MLPERRMSLMQGSYQAAGTMWQNGAICIVKLRNTGRLLPPEQSSGDQPRYSPRILTSPVPADRTRVPVTRSGAVELICTNTLETLFQLHRQKCPARARTSRNPHVAPKQLADDIIAYIRTHYCGKSVCSPWLTIFISVPTTSSSFKRPEEYFHDALCDPS